MDIDPTDSRSGPEVGAFRGSEPAGGGPRRVLVVGDEPGAADLAVAHGWAFGPVDEDGARFEFRTDE